MKKYLSKWKERTLQMLAAVVLVLCLVGAGSEQRILAEETVVDEGECGTSVTWKLTGEAEAYTLTISGSGNMKDWGRNEAKPWDGYNTGIKTVVIEEGVTGIGAYAFYGCTSLTAVDLGSVTSIGESAFRECSSLTAVDLGSVTSIQAATFIQCTSLTTVNLSDVTSIGKNAFNGCSSLTSVDLGSVTSIGEYAFDGCSSLTVIDMPKVTSIGDRAFVGCSGLISVSMPEMTSVNHGIFINCSKLETVAMPKVTSIGNYAFQNCSVLATLNLSAVTSIGANAFNSCSDLTTMDLPNVTSVGEYAFYSCSALETIKMPKVTRIENRVFESCIALTTIELSSGVTSIGSYAFWGCKVLKEMQLPNVTSIGNSAFSGCYALKTIEVPNVTSIGNSAFSSCRALTTMDLPNVISVGKNAFSSCYALTTIEMPKVTSIGDGAFSACNELISVTAPCDLEYTFYNTPEVTRTHAFTNGVCTGCNILNTTLKSRSLTLDGVIGMNFYFEVDEAIVNSGDASVEFKMEEGRTISVPVSSERYDNEQQLYKFTCPVYSTEMADTVTATVVWGEKKSEAYERTVASYAETMINDTSGTYSDKAKALVKAILNYGAYAQMNFTYNTGKLANAVLAGGDRGISGDVEAATFFQELTNTVPATIGKYAGSRLMLGSETTLKVYFLPANGVTASEISFTKDGNTLKATTETDNGTEYLVLKITNISADKLDAIFDISVKYGGVESGTFQCSVFRYCYNVLNNSGNYNENLVNTLKALYVYNKATLDYINYIN